eukprot:54648-Eustigmatos_ZCMA.PRE.1
MIIRPTCVTRVCVQLCEEFIWHYVSNGAPVPEAYKTTTKQALKLASGAKRRELKDAIMVSRGDKLSVIRAMEVEYTKHFSSSPCVKGYTKFR